MNLILKAEEKTENYVLARRSGCLRMFGNTKKRKRYYSKIKREYRRCTNCGMDTTDSKISFDKSGVCDFYRDYYTNVLPVWKPQENNPELLKLADGSGRPTETGHMTAFSE